MFTYLHNVEMLVNTLQYLRLSCLVLQEHHGLSCLLCFVVWQSQRHKICCRGIELKVYLLSVDRDTGIQRY
jgi:hypothetical protein